MTTATHRAAHMHGVPVHTRPHLCPDCGEPIERTDSGAWWRHVGLNGDCWRLSMDGPQTDDAEFQS